MKLGGGSGWPLAAAERIARQGALLAGKSRLDQLNFYPKPVSLRRVRVHVWPRFFRIPGLREFDGFAGFFGQIVLREPIATAGADLLCHELCHVWQMQHHPVGMPLSYLCTGYARNPYEVEARRAVSLTQPTL